MLKGEFAGRRERQQRHEDGGRRQEDDEDEADPVELPAHASTARPLSANMPRGRFWMNRMMMIRSTIWP